MRFETKFSREAIKNNRQSIKGKFYQWQKLELCKVVHNALITQKYTDKANEDVPLTV